MIKQEINSNQTFYTSTLMNFLFFFFVFLIALLYTSIFEWVLHRYIMHRVIFGFRYAYDAHHEVHHGLFRSDTSYHLGDRGEKIAKTIPMAWWNGPVLICIATIPSIPISLWFDTWYITIITALTITCYYGIYEYMHWCFHLPKERRLEKSSIFKRLNTHHLLHHRYKGAYNFNVVLPFADLIFRTLATEKK